MCDLKTVSTEQQNVDFAGTSKGIYDFTLAFTREVFFSQSYFRNLWQPLIGCTAAHCRLIRCRINSRPVAKYELEQPIPWLLVHIDQFYNIR